MLENLPTFVAVARSGSFTRAARELGQTVAAVSKTVARLEGELGAKVFFRTTRNVTLTETGQSLLSSAERILAERDVIEANITNQRAKPAGPLSVALPVSLGGQGRGRYSLVRAMVAFAQKNPDISMRTILSDASVDIVREQIDVAVRISPLEDTSLKVRIISPCPFALVAAPAYIARTGTPVRPSDLKSHAWLAYQNHSQPSQLRYVDASGKAATLSIPCAFSSNNGDQLITAVLAGMGVTLLPRLFIEDDLSNGRLVQLLPDLKILPERYLALYYPDAGAVPAKTRAFIDFMVDWFAACTAEPDNR